eukprot:TRINITY_DN7267_c0_g1_i2.p1 TRINITY_DN7267_c0_g1~~TRINITY_DN7267_c0_g1_i2.p1  ORF type:complete len:132 (-),score=27.75 TRINITY_DN7267_c0_g1_i2:89-484(-)
MQEDSIPKTFRYYRRCDAEDCVKYINGTKLDDRMIRTDWDAGFKKDRELGRGKDGGQVRDEYRDDYDPGRGGYGQKRHFEDYEQKETYENRRYKKRREDSSDDYDSRPSTKRRDKSPSSSRFRDGIRSDED